MTGIFFTIPWFLSALRAGGPIQPIANLVKEFHEDVEYYIYCNDTDLNGAALARAKYKIFTRVLYYLMWAKT